MKGWLLPAAALVTLLGCGEPGGSPIDLFVGLDTSGSAEAEKAKFYKRALDANKRILAAPAGSTIELYRFDDAVHEIYVGAPIDQPSQLAQKLRDSLNPSQATTGTNLLKLMETIDARLDATAGEARLLVLTDCGTELMTPKEFGVMESIAKKWARGDKVKEMRIAGLRPLHRDVLRKRLSALGPRLVLE